MSLKNVLEEKVIPYADKVFELLGIYGPLSLQFNLFNVLKLRADTDKDFNSPESGNMHIEKQDINFVEELSIDELRFNPDNVSTRLMDRLASLFGMWRK